MELLEQAAQRQRRRLAVVRHKRRGCVRFAVDCPTDDGRRSITRRAVLAALATVTLGARPARLAGRRDQLPIRPRADAGRVLARDEAGPIEGHDIEVLIFFRFAVGATNCWRARICASSSDTGPIGVRGLVPSIFSSLIRGASMYNHFASVMDLTGRIESGSSDVAHGAGI